MGLLKKKVLGAPSGKVGDLTFRNRGGETIVATLPASFMPGKDEASVARRNRFGLTVKMSSAINYLSQLKHFWKLYGNDTTKYSSPFNKMVKGCYPNVSDTNLLSTASLVPEIGFEITTTSFAVTDSGVDIVISPIGTDKGIDTGVETSYQIACVVFMKTPTGDSAPFYFLHKLSEVAALNLITPLTVSIPFDNIEGQYFDLYSTQKGLISLITLDVDGKPIRYSNTVQSA